MARYRYRAMDRQGKVSEGMLAASNLAALSELLRGEGQFLLSASLLAEQASPAASASVAAKPQRAPGRASKPTEAEVIAFNNQLTLMLRSAVPVLEALENLCEQQPNPTFKAVLEQIAAEVRGGGSLSGSFSKHPELFDQVYLSLLEAGEKSGTLPRMMERITAHLAFKASIRSKIRSAMLYPAIVMGTALLVVLGLLIFVLPTFAEVFDQFDADLPPVTRFLLVLSASLRGYWFVYLGVVGFFLWRFLRWLRTPSNRYAFDTFLLELPIIGVLLRAIVVSRITRTLGELLKAGVHILKAIELTEGTAGNQVFTRMLKEMGRTVAGGQGVALGFAACDYVPSMVSHLLASAEKAGRLPEALSFIADFYQAEVDVALHDFFSALEPVFVVFLGLTIGGIAISFLLPIFRLGGVVQ